MVKATACALLRNRRLGSSLLHYSRGAPLGCCPPPRVAHSVRDGPGSINRSCKLHILEMDSGLYRAQITVSDVGAGVRCLALGVMFYSYIISSSDRCRKTVRSNMGLMMDHLNTCRPMSCMRTKAPICPAREMTCRCLVCLLWFVFFFSVAFPPRSAAGPSALDRSRYR